MTDDCPKCQRRMDRSNIPFALIPYIDKIDRKTPAMSVALEQAIPVFVKRCSYCGYMELFAGQGG